MVQFRKKPRCKRRSSSHSTAERQCLVFDRLEPRSMLAAGVLDLTFGTGGLARTDFGSIHDFGWSVAMQTDGKIVVAGHSQANPNLAFALARYNSDGSLDSTFGTGGKVEIDISGGYDVALDVAIQPDGKIIAAGYANHFGVGSADFAAVRLSTNGSLDSSFGNSGIVVTNLGSHDVANAIAIQADGKILLAGGRGSPPDVAIVRYLPNGTLDSSFDGDGIVVRSFGNSESANGIVVQANGQIVVGGGVDYHGFAARFNANGQIDSTYGVSGVAYFGFGTNSIDYVQAIDLQADGKLILGGFSNAIGGGSSYDFSLARLNIDGTLDTSFDNDGIAFADIASSDQAIEGDIAIQSDGRILIGGWSSNGNSKDFTVARFDQSGALDTSFGTGGIAIEDFSGGDDLINGLAVQSDGKIIAVGRSYSSQTGGFDFAVARFGGDSQPTKISGYLYNDSNNDGSFQAGSGEVGISGIAVWLTGTDTSNNVVNRSTLTLASGKFVFENVLAGTYSLSKTQPTGLLDGKETLGNRGGTVNNSIDNNTISNIVIGNEGIEAVDYLFGNLQPAELSGMVWEDFNADGQVNFGEKAIANALVTLTGTDDRGATVHFDAHTDAGGAYMFFDLRPGIYNLVQTQSAGFMDGVDVLGTVNGIPAGIISGNDRFVNIALGTGSVGLNYNFGERPLAGGNVTPGQTASIGFWQNNNGRALILSLNGGANSTRLSSWLAATFPNMYGTSAGANNLTGKYNIQVWDFYNILFRRKQQEAQALGLSGPTKTDAQIFASALAVYVTNQTLAGSTATSFGFVVTQNGLGVASFSVGTSGQAFGVANNSSTTVLDLLLAVNSRSRNGVLYDMDGDGDANDSLETSLRTMANNIFSAINERGDH